MHKISKTSQKTLNVKSKVNFKSGMGNLQSISQMQPSRDFNVATCDWEACQSHQSKWCFYTLLTIRVKTFFGLQSTLKEK